MLAMASNSFTKDVVLLDSFPVQGVNYTGGECPPFLIFAEGNVWRILRVTLLQLILGTISTVQS